MMKAPKKRTKPFPVEIMSHLVSADADDINFNLSDEYKSDGES